MCRPHPQEGERLGGQPGVAFHQPLQPQEVGVRRRVRRQRRLSRRIRRLADHKARDDAVLALQPVGGAAAGGGRRWLELRACRSSAA